MTISVTPAAMADAEELADLMEELDSFYGAPPTDPREQRIAYIKELVFADRSSPAVLLARHGREVVGMAAYSFLWPAAGVTQSLFLKELYVRERARRRGIGRLLMDRIRGIAAENGCSRVEWTTETDNETARRFYEALGFIVHAGKVFYRAAP